MMNKTTTINNTMCKIVQENMAKKNLATCIFNERWCTMFN